MFQRNGRRLPKHEQNEGNEVSERLSRQRHGTEFTVNPQAQIEATRNAGKSLVGGVQGADLRRRTAPGGNERGEVGLQKAVVKSGELIYVKIVYVDIPRR